MGRPKETFTAGLFARRYPWANWFSKKSFTLVKGRDYNGRTYSMVQQIRNTAGLPRYRKRVHAEVSPDENTIVVKVIGPAGPVKAKPRVAPAAARTTTRQTTVNGVPTSFTNDPADRPARRRA